MRMMLRVATLSSLGIFLACGGSDDAGGGGFADADAGTGAVPDAGNGNVTDAGATDAKIADSGGADACASDHAAPHVTSSLADIGFPIGSGTASRTVVFDEPVTIDVGGIVIAPGATLTVTPSLPATGKTFTVVASGLDDGKDYTLSALAAKTHDACGNALAADVTSKFMTGCASDTTDPTMTSTSTLVLPAGETTLTHDLVFDEVVSIGAAGIAVSGGTLVVTPALPATASSFHLELSALSSAQNYNLTVASSAVADRCGNALDTNITVPIAGQCVGDVTPPSITSSNVARRFMAGALTHTFVFDEPVAIAAGGIAVSGGATIAITPALPAKASSFKVDLTSLVDGTTYTLTASAAAIADQCAHPLAADQTVSITSCAGDVAPPAVTSRAFTGVCGGPTQSYDLKFDEAVVLAADALSVDGAATIDSVTPALPALATTFTVKLGNVTGAHTLSVATGKAADECTNALAAPFTVSTGDTKTFDYTGAIVDFAIPACGKTTIEAWGAQGGYNTSSGTTSGLGARMRGDFDGLTPRDVKLLVGEMPANGNGNGGGGGTFVVAATNNAPLLVAGGGGGSGTTDAPYKHGVITTSGQSSSDGGGTGGADGAGGAIGGAGFQSGAGGGLLSSGADGWTSGTGGKSFLLGGSGGTTNALARGGFGGGGSGSSYVVGGGGGGYSGGGSSSNFSGQGKAGPGGGSFNSGTNQDNTPGARSGHGRITITWR